LAESAVFLMITLPWVLFASLYFGSPIPNSILAKSLAYQIRPLEGLVRLLQHYGTPFFEQNLFGPYWPLFGFIVYLTLSISGGLAIMRREPRAWPMVAFPWLYFAAYSAANPLIFRWYLAPPLPFYFLLILTGIQRLLQTATAARQLWQPPIAQRWMAAPIAAFAALSLAAWTLRPDHGPTQAGAADGLAPVGAVLRRRGARAGPKCDGSTVVAAGDVGALGYYSGARILDTVGLMLPEASRYYPLDPAIYVTNYAIPPQLILDQRPDYVVLLEIYGRNGLLKEPRFHDAYALVRKLDTDIYDSQGLLVFKRRAP
jgi:hypothetical protein